MHEQEMRTTVNAAMLVAAFPATYEIPAQEAGAVAAELFAPRQWTEFISLRCGTETIAIPARLHFIRADDGPLSTNGSTNDEAWLLLRALQTRSNDGFERQRATRDLLAAPQPWAAPFLLLLMGEYIVEILEDILNAMSPELEQMLRACIAENETFWATIKRRIASYWNVYYRHAAGNQGRKHCLWADYPGFHLIRLLEARPFATRAGLLTASSTGSS
ncbi:hypothetical protein [Novosphingobium sp. 9]|uniref:hypothetical protein n=1 Tax=Novosphingobium sp. 9 TaxID=2025349 RepID=UPI0021B5E83D|nr:hypothetical protein [Novosphingobium sp. 9]